PAREPVRQVRARRRNAAPPAPGGSTPVAPAAPLRSPAPREGASPAGETLPWPPLPPAEGGIPRALAPHRPGDRGARREAEPASSPPPPSRRGPRKPQAPYLLCHGMEEDPEGGVARARGRRSRIPGHQSPRAPPRRPEVRSPIRPDPAPDREGARGGDR